MQRLLNLYGKQTQDWRKATLKTTAREKNHGCNCRPICDTMNAIYKKKWFQLKNNNNNNNNNKKPKKLK